MKKSFKWLLCASLVASVCVAGAACSKEEPHEHTYGTTYTYDENGHWYGATCEHTDLKLSLALHTGLADGVCDTCGYDEHAGEGHTYATEWSKDETNHWHAANCGHEVEGADKAAHVDENNNKECDTCGYDYNHTHSYATTWSNDATNHWHAATCECSIEGADKAAHEDEDKNGVCDVCQGATFDSTHTHEYESGNNWSKDEDNHWYAATCDHTGLTQNVTPHNDADKDGDCDVCGWYDEGHTHTYATEWSKNDTKHWHAANCGHSGLKQDEEGHNMVNGECDVCGFDGGHEHTYADDWKSDATNHWLETNCDSGCTLTVAVTAHDGMEDGVCDTCGWYDESHSCTAADAWVTDANNHWKVCASHSAITFEDGAHEGMADGVCDVCGYKDYAADHAHVWDADGVWTSDYTAHWIASSCHSGVVKEGTYAAHADETTLLEDASTQEGADGYCDVCGQELFESIIAKILSNKVNVKNGNALVEAADYGASEYYYEFGENYLFKLDLVEGYKYWYHNYNDAVFAMQQTNSVVEKAYVDSEAGLNVLNGIEFNTGYYVTGAYGLEETIATLYAQAANKYTTFTAYNNGDTYGFAFDYLQAGYYNYIVEVSVEFTIDQAEVYSYDIWDYVYYDFVSEATIVVNTYEVAETEDGYVKTDASMPYMSKTFEVSQVGGAQTAVSPFDPAEYFVSSYGLVYNDTAFEDGDTLTLEKGMTANLYYEDVVSKTGTFEYDTMTFTVLDAENNEYDGLTLADYDDNLYVNVSSAAAGTYTVTVKTMNTEKTFTVVVTLPVVSSFDAWVYDDSKTVTTTWNAYAGDTIEFGAKANNYANNGYTVVASGEEGDVTLNVPETTNNTSDWAYGYSNSSTATFNKVGTYTLTLTSLGDSNFTATITVTVSEPPKTSDVINGTKGYTDNYGSGQSINVTFTPASEGAVTGTAVIYIIEDLVAINTYNVNYAYDETNGLVLTNTDGSSFTDVTIIYEHYELSASWTYEGWWGPEPTEPGVLTEATPYTPPKAEDIVAGQYRYEAYDESGWRLAYAIDIVLDANGTGTYTRWHLDENYNQANDATGTFTWTVKDNGDGTYDVTITIVTGTELTAGTYKVGTTYNNYGESVKALLAVAVTIDGTASTVDFPIYY